MEFSDPNNLSRTSENILRKKASREFEYLCVEDFVADIFHARALATAFETGLIDRFIRNKSISYQSLLKQGDDDHRGMRLLIGLLLENRVVNDCNGAIQLTEEFVHALEFRDLLELKSALANMAAHDFLDHFSDLVYRPDNFFQKAKFCRLFSYDRCYSHSRENYEATKRWVRITTTLTKYEAHACMKYHDFGRHRNILDIGGNSGEFVLQICRKYPLIRATVFDLPLVCEIGRKHVHSAPEADRISFVEGNAFTDALPEDFDLIAFKSMLHDWPERDAAQLLRKASQSLTPGGTLLIFERGPLETGAAKLSYSILPFLLFFHSFRSPAPYEKQLESLDFVDITVKKIFLETPFFMVTGKKGK